MSFKAQVVAINQLLSDIYKHNMRLSYLLANLSFNPEDIELINQELQSNVVAIFLNILEKTILSFQDGVRQFEIIEDVYGLTGDRSSTLKQVGAKFNLSHQRVGQLKQKVLKQKVIRKLIAKNNKSFWESEFEREVRQLLKKYSNCARLHTRARSCLQKHDFDYLLLPNGEECLVISENNCQITIRKSDFEDFYSSLIENIRLLEWNINKIESATEKYSRAYERWTPREEKWLRDYLEEGLKIREIATLLERQPSAISSRIQKLGLPYI